MKDALRKMPYSRKKRLFQKAVEKGIQMCRQIREDEANVRKGLDSRGIDYRFSESYFTERFDELKGYLEQLEDSRIDPETVGAVLKKLPQYRRRTVAEFRKHKAIVPYDYAPRNMMVENEAVPIDHETYRQGHPVSVVVTLLNNPENGFRNGTYQSLMHSGVEKLEAEGIQCPEKTIQASRIFWNARQARGLARTILQGEATGQDVEHLNWYLKDMAEAA